jgi:phospholipid transport system substrate-binding protein
MFRYLALFLLLFAAPASAATEADARRFVETLAPRVIQVIDAPGASRAEKQKQLEQLFLANVDADWMGRFALGQYWGQLTPEQQQRYLAAHRNYLLARYTTNFTDYSGSKYTITGVKDSGDGEFNVSMNIQSSKEDVGAGYKLRTVDGGFKIYDIIVEGVSLITTHRSEFTSVAQKDGIEGLIRQLEAKTQAKTGV